MERPTSHIAIKLAQDTDQLEQVWSFAASILDLPAGKHTLQYYTEQLAKTPHLLVYAECGKLICGCILASVENDHILVGPVAVAKYSRRIGIGAVMMREIETQAVKKGYHTLILGSVEEAEPFYLSCGFRPNLFVQVPELVSIEQPKSLNEGYEVIWEAQQEGWSKIMLYTLKINRSLQRIYEQKFPTCFTQYVFIKHL